MSDLRVESLNAGYGDALVLKELSLELPYRRITALIGANGSGKSTLLKTIARLLKPRSGAVLLDGKDIQQRPTLEVARRLAILPQAPEAPGALTVGELVSFGRFPHRQFLQALSRRDRECIHQALSACGLGGLHHRALETLSGGQRQRAWIAMALAQDTDYLLLDEPTTFLDLAHQLEVLELLRTLAVERNRTVIMAIHDIQQAARYADCVVALCEGRISAQGTPRDVITEKMLLSVFNVQASVFDDPARGGLICVPLSIASPIPKE